MPKLKIPTFSVDEMLARDGFYVITNLSMLQRGSYAICEVEAGKCFQLNPERVRDGELEKDGWKEGVILFDEEVWNKAIAEAMAAGLVSEKK